MVFSYQKASKLYFTDLAPKLERVYRGYKSFQNIQYKTYSIKTIAYSNNFWTEKYACPKNLILPAGHLIHR